MGNARARRIPAQMVEDEEYQLRHERVAGIDIAKAKADVCTRLPPAARGRAAGVAGGGGPRGRGGGPGAGGAADSPPRSSSSSWSPRRTTGGSGTTCWRGAGLNVQLVNSSQARQLAGRPKTDRLDAQWIARLAEMGLLRPSFVPPPEIRALRDLTRTRLQLVRDRTREWQRLEKLLEGALVKLSSALSSLARTKTARTILEAIAGGERDPKALAALAGRASAAAAPPSRGPWTA